MQSDTVNKPRIKVQVNMVAHLDNFSVGYVSVKIKKQYLIWTSQKNVGTASSPRGGSCR